MAFEEMASVVSITMKVFIVIMAASAIAMAIKKKHFPALIIIVIAAIAGLLLAGGISLVVSIGYLMWATAQEKKANAATAAKTTAPATTTPVATVTTVAPVKAASKEKAETEEKKIKCRFCKKSYSSEYNGCPYCKKK